MHATTLLVRVKLLSTTLALATAAACSGSPAVPPPGPPAGGGSSGGGGPPPGPPPDVVISGTIYGYQSSGLVLYNMATGERLSVTGGATSFAFARRMKSHEHFDLWVVGSPQPPHQACNIQYPFGVAGESGANNHVTCTSDASEVGQVRGTIVGLTGSGLELMLSNEATVEPGPGVTDFVFPTALWRGDRYTVGISRQPVAPAQTCVIRHGKGVVPNEGDAGDVLVECMDNVTSPLTGTYGFETGAGQRGYFTFFPGGTYSFVVRMDDPACGTNDGNGVEYGVYRWNAESGEFSIRSAVVDTNGVCGIADLSGAAPALTSGTLTKSATGLQLVAGNDVHTLVPVTSAAWMVGSFLHGTGAIAGATDWYYVQRVSGAFTVMNADDTYVSVETQDAVNGDSWAGAEWGCAAYSPYVLEQLCYTGDPRYLDLNGSGGLSSVLRYDANARASELGGAEAWYVSDGTHIDGHMESWWTKFHAR